MTIFFLLKGDSGGPLFIKEGNKYVLVGITSFGGPVCNGKWNVSNKINKPLKILIKNL